MRPLSKFKSRFTLILLALLGILILLVLAVLMNTARQVSKQTKAQAVAPISIDENGVLNNLSQSIQFATVSSAEDANLNAEEFRRLHQLFRRAFPNVYQRAHEEIIGNLSILLTIPGTQADAQPILLLAHQDVVPIAPGTEAAWTYPPFSGAIKDQFVWGRGAWDNKSNLMAQLEALELLLKSGFQNQRTIYLAFGADEEVQGLRGAAQIASMLKQRQIRLHSVLDEGLLITHGMLPGLDAPAALIGVAEKGYLSVEITVKAVPGHSSMPPNPGQSAIAKLGKVISYIDQHPRPLQIAGVARELFNTVGPEMQGLNKYALTNLWLLRPVVEAQLRSSDASRALLQSTTALTIVQAGNKENVLPGQAQAIVNYRLLPGDSSSAVVADLKTAIGTLLSEAEFSVRALPNAVEASRISSHRSLPYQILQQSIKDIFPEVVTAPGLMLGATDSIKFEELSDHIYKFSPVHANDRDLQRFHGTDERVSVSNYLDMIRFYYLYLSRASRLE
ncbi:M20 family peptidase [Undibacterium cyanobacteriorum]|uniref:M20 family peptidase n=2 Tax=Undibacterium cyanobacteriorum TaxID=3073561 RepID=A0ABY9RPG9_9BURK|nr:M20 family peptidase [Undibacterium sp. 20NA77.5]WMW82575.1 M20 family peptidase [Undibacterium sp. 20NA77.5]